MLASCGGESSQSAAKTTAVPVALTCATGGTCVVGDSGPGGGIVFYVAATSFACGATLASSCIYLEAAPSGWFVSPASGCEAAESLDVDPTCVWWSIEPMDAGDGQYTTGTTGKAIGTGYKNTTEIVTQYGTGVAPAAASQDYRGGGLSDWFLPSKDELNEMCIYFSGVPKVGGVCNGNGAADVARAGVGGFANDYYWSSTEKEWNEATGDPIYIFMQRFADGLQAYGGDNSYVRPVRASTFSSI